MNVQGFGASMARISGYYKQGNWYRGGAVQMLFSSSGSTATEPGPADVYQRTSRGDLIRTSRLFDLAPQIPTVDWSKALAHLPVQDILTRQWTRRRASSPTPCPSIYGSQMIQRAPNDAGSNRRAACG